MKIVDVEARLLRVPIHGPGFGGNILKGMPPMQAYPYVLVKVSTDEGITGVGGMDGRPFETAGIKGWSSYIRAVVKPLLVEELVEPFYTERFMRRIRTEPQTYIGPRPACIEMALWDIIGKSAKLPVYKLFGAYRDKVKAYVNAGPPNYPPWTPKEWTNFFLARREEGFRAVKMFIDPSHEAVESVIESVKIIRETVGYDMDIMVDAVSAYGPESMTFEKALKLARGLEKYDCVWLEEPLPNLYNIELCARLAKMVDIPIAGGGLVFGIYNFRMLLEKGALDVVQPDAGYTGLSEVKKVAEMAEYFGKSCSPHLGGPGIVMRASLHVIGSTNMPWCEMHYKPPFWTHEVRDSILKEPTKITKDGYIEIPNRPGLGLELNDELVEKFTVQEAEV